MSLRGVFVFWAGASGLTVCVSLGVHSLEGEDRVLISWIWGAGPGAGGTLCSRPAGGG